MTSPVASLYSESCTRCGVHALDEVSAQLRLLHTTVDDDNENNNNNNTKNAAMTLCVHSIALDAAALHALTPALHHEACRRRLRVVDLAYCALDNVAMTCVVRLFAGGFPVLREVVLTGNPFTYRAGKRLAWMCEGITSLLSRPVTTPPTRRAHAHDAMCVRGDEGSSKCNDVGGRRARSQSRRRRDNGGDGDDVNDDDDDDDDDDDMDDVYAWVGWDNNIVRVDLANTFMSTVLQACVQRRIAAAIARREARKTRLRQQQQQRPASSSTLSTSRNVHVAEAYVAAVPHDVVVQRCRAVPLRGCSDVHSDYDSSNDDSSNDHADHVTDGHGESNDDKRNDTHAAHDVTATRERVAATTPRQCVATVARAGGAVLMQDSYLCDCSRHDAHEQRTNDNDPSSCGGLPHYSAADTSMMPTQCVARDVSLSNSRTSPLSALAPERLFDWDSLHKQRNYDSAVDEDSRSSSGGGKT